MRTRQVSPDAPFQSIETAARLTGLGRAYIRQGCIAGTIPHVRRGRCYLVNVPALLRQLGVTEG